MKVSGPSPSPPNSPQGWGTKGRGAGGEQGGLSPSARERKPSLREEAELGFGTREIFHM